MSQNSETTQKESYYYMVVVAAFDVYQNNKLKDEKRTP